MPNLSLPWTSCPAFLAHAAGGCLQNLAHDQSASSLDFIPCSLGTCCRGSRAARSDYLQYCNSKVFLLMFTAELQKRLHAAGSSIDVFAAHPGVALTDAYRFAD